MKYSKIVDIEFDLNTVCNSVCPTCHRYQEQDGELYLNPLVKFNHQIDISLVEKVFQNDRLADDIRLAFVGSVGEPIAHPQFLDIIEIVYKYRPNAIINIHTNGGNRNPAFFTKLAKLIKKNRGHVQFSFDGLEDTNSIYRRGVIWDKALENMQAYIDAGGEAQWNFIVFKWNKHQIEEARELANTMGCREFNVLQNREPENRMSTYLTAAENKTHKTKSDMPTGVWKLNPKKYHPVEDRCISMESLYINAFGIVLPCCMFNTSITDFAVYKEARKFIFGENKKWNSLEHHSMESIIANDWWDFLENSFTSNPCTMCLDACAKKKI